MRRWAAGAGVGGKPASPACPPTSPTPPLSPSSPPKQPRLAPGEAVVPGHGVGELNSGQLGVSHVVSKKMGGFGAWAGGLQGEVAHPLPAPAPALRPRPARPAPGQKGLLLLVCQHLRREGEMKCVESRRRAGAPPVACPPARPHAGSSPHQCPHPYLVLRHQHVLRDVDQQLLLLELQGGGGGGGRGGGVGGQGVGVP